MHSNKDAIYMKNKTNLYKDNLFEALYTCNTSRDHTMPIMDYLGFKKKETEWRVLTVFGCRQAEVCEITGGTQQMQWNKAA